MKAKTVSAKPAPVKAAPALPKKGDILTKVLVTRRWGRHALQALQSLSFLLYMDSKVRGTQAKYRVLKAFPADIPRVIHEFYLKPVNEALDEAFGEVEALKEELDDWYNNLPESFQSGDKGDQLQSAINELEGISDYRDATTTAMLETLPKIHVWPSGTSRGDRCAGAAAVCESVRAAIAEKIQALKAAEPTTDVEALEECDENLDEVISTLQSVEFPGMY